MLVVDKVSGSFIDLEGVMGLEALSFGDAGWNSVGGLSLGNPWGVGVREEG